MKTGFSRLSAILVLLLLAASARAQEFDFGPLGGLGNIGGEQVTIAAEFVTAPESRGGELRVTATIEPGWHIYSITQAKGGPTPTRIEVTAGEGYRLAGDFKADQAPKIETTDLYKVPLEEHFDTVTWRAPIVFTDEADLSALEIPLKVSVLVCNDSCVPKTLRAAASYAGDDDSVAAPAEPAAPEAATAAAARGDTPSTSDTFVAATPESPFRGDRWNVEFSGEMEPASVEPGGTAQLKFTAKPLGEYYIYAWEAGDKPGALWTRLGVELPPGWTASNPVPSQPAKVKKSTIGEPDQWIHKGPVTWTIAIQVPADAEAGSYEVSGAAAFHICTERMCDAPNGVLFRAPLIVGEATRAAPPALAFSLLPDSIEQSPYKAAEELAAGMRTRSGTPAVAAAPFDLDTLDVQGDSEKRTLLAVIGIALVGGLILNIMPCVLPVIGLKVMSFVQQAGESRAKIFALNMWYVLGMMAVFWVLATMLAVWNVAWGEQFSNNIFQVVMASVVFAMALSLLGVWEVPIPGFAGSSKAIEASEKEGPLGAVLKGVLTTILATPCLAPGMGSAIAWCNGKPPYEVYLVFTALGLGMALPYIAIGIQPKLIRFLPKPGAWMDTFKQLMGFMLLGTVVFFFTFMPWELIVPTLALLFGIWAGVWWIGRTPIYAEFQTKLRAWAFGGAFAALVGIVAFTWLADYSRDRFEGTIDRRIAARYSESKQIAALTEGLPGLEESEIPWQPFSEEKLKELAAQDRTIMIDFTADWCLTCKTLEKTVLNTEPIREALRSNNVETLIADWTDGDESITLMLNRLGSAGVPVLAIFPAGRPHEPIVLKDGYTRSIVLQKLQEAGPSKTAAPREEVAEKPSPMRGA